VRLLRNGLIAILTLAAAALAAVYFVRPGMDAYRAHQWPPSPHRDGAVRATWFGVTSLMLDDGAHAILVDPFFTRPEGLLPFVRNGLIAPDEPRIAASLQKLGARSVDAVLVSHSHFDHAMDAGVVARMTGAVLVGSESTANIGRGAGVAESKLHVISPGAPLTFGDFKVTFIASKHAGATGGRPTGDITQPLKPPAHYLDYKLGGTYSILIEHPQGSLLLHGSAGFVPGALQGHHADVVFLGIALVDDLPTYLHEVVDAVGAKRIVPTHWDDFTRSLERPLEPFPIVVSLPKFFRQVSARSDLSVRTLEPFQPVDVFSAD